MVYLQPVVAQKSHVTQMHWVWHDDYYQNSTMSMVGRRRYLLYLADDYYQNSTMSMVGRSRYLLYLAGQLVHVVEGFWVSTAVYCRHLSEKHKC
jgi:hypothetical protein